LLKIICERITQAQGLISKELIANSFKKTHALDRAEDVCVGSGEQRINTVNFQRKWQVKRYVSFSKDVEQNCTT
jgi:hypothetical protein